MVKLSDLLVDNSLHGQGTDRRGVIRSPVLIFMTSSITYRIVMLTIDGVTSLLQLIDVQNVHKSTHFSLNKRCGNSGSLLKMAESFIFLIFLYVRIEIDSR